MAARPNLDAILEQIKDNTRLTHDVHDEVQELKAEVKQGFKDMNGRVGKNTDDIKDLLLQRKYDEKIKRDAAEQARDLVETAAIEARQLIIQAKTETNASPVIGSNKWLIGFLASMILALIAVIGTQR